MGSPQYADISSYQGTIDWQKYAAWARQWDGTSRVAMKATEGTGFTDPRFAANRAGALAAGVDSIIYYHYGRPDLTSATAEANWMFHVVGNVRDSDAYMLDYEQNTSAATAQWAYEFLSRLEALTGRLPIIYASTSFIQAHLQDARLAKYPLVLASWTYDVNKPPACPKPWSAYTYWQYTDKGTVPGILTPVDVNVYLGGGTTTSTYELVNFPMISQRDGDANQDADCVPASIAACMQWLTGQHFTASEIKDAVYGASYTGGTAATAYVDYCTTHGVTLAPINGTGPALVTAIRGALAEQRPCLITEPDPYAAGWTHVCAAYKCDAGSITVMDPWIDAPVTKTDAQWASQLEFNQIWVLELSMLNISSVSHYFTDQGNSVWKCTNGNLLGHGMLNYYCTTGSAPLFGLTLYGLPLTGEIAIPGHTGVVLQVFERGVLAYDPGHVIDSPPGAGSVYAMHLDKGDALAQLAKFLPTPTPTPAPVDTSAVEADINAITDGLAPLIAKVLVDLKKL